MGDLLDSIHQRYFHSSPSFQDFIIASQRVKPSDALVLKDGRLEKTCSFEPDEKELNEVTWSAFRRAIEREFTDANRDAICKRYGFDWQRIAYSPYLPLERRYVEYFGVGAANPKTANLTESLASFSWFPPPFENQSTEEVHRLHEHATRLRFLGNMEDPCRVHGGAVEKHENFTNDPFLMDKHRANLYRGVEELVSHDPNIPRLHPYYSRLSMGIVSLLETKKNVKDVDLVVPAPGAIDGTLEYYKVHDIISEGGLTAVALVPVSEDSKSPPILSFRCTKQTLGHTDVIPSLLNNMEEVIGESGYKASYEKLKDLMEDPAFTRGRKIKLLCYSLGGGHAGYFMRDFWPQVEEFVGFNCVGSDARVVESLAKQINSLDEREIPPQFTIYRNISNHEGTLGDWVNKTGQKHIGWGIKHPNARVQVVEWIIDDYHVPSEDIYDPEQIIRWLTIHGARPMDSELEGKFRGKFQSPWCYHYNIYRGTTNCNRILDTYNRDPTLEDLRIKVGHEVLYKFISTTYSILDFILRLFGLEFFRERL
ncbi:MAG: hypothetical protein KR126chlam3_00929 [Chlamydiae bacterium]|nr:hypothetical protein [Chlamydiota bacterium]